MKKAFIITIFLVPCFFSCDEVPIEGECGPLAIITDRFDSEITDQYTITQVAIDNTCINIEVAAGGCDGESWTAELLVSPSVAESFPPQVLLRMILDDDELCEALIRKTFTFDLLSLDEISDRMILQLEGWDQSISYPISD